MALAPRTRGAALDATSAPHLFLSHSSEDKKLVTDLARNLNTCGVDVWLDAWELRGAEDLHERIADAIAKSKFVGVVVTSRFDGSRWVKGEVSQALSREKASGRALLLPLLIEKIDLPPVLSSKKFLDFTPESYFASLVRLAGLIHDLSTEGIEMAIEEIAPTDLRGCLRALEFVGFNPYCVVDTQTLAAIRAAGGSASGDTIVHFDPRKILADPTIPPSLRKLMERLATDWNL